MANELKIPATSPWHGPGGDEHGFTLLEVLIALAIMVICFASVLSVESGAINASARAKTMNIVQMLAKNQMIETEYRIQGQIFDAINKKDGGKFPDPYQDYRWTTTVKQIDFPNLSGIINAAASGGGGGGGSGGGGGGGGGGGADSSANAGAQQPVSDIGQQVSRLVTQYLSQAVREVTVTIYWKKGEGEQRYSVSTYWVDLGHDFQIQ